MNDLRLMDLMDKKGKIVALRIQCKTTCFKIPAHHHDVLSTKYVKCLRPLFLSLKTIKNHSIIDFSNNYIENKFHIGC